MQDDKPIHVGARELRGNLKKYLDMVDQGHEVTIIRDSIILGKIVPDEAILAIAEERQKQAVEHLYALPDGREMRIRQLQPYEDSEPVRQLHLEAMVATGANRDKLSVGFDLNGPRRFYKDYRGEFWIGEVGGELVAMGAFKRLDFDRPKTAEIKRMRVKPALHGQGIGRGMLSLLEERARLAGYTEAVLDVTDVPGQAAARHLYESHGYQEYKREPFSNHHIIFYRKPL